MLSSARPPTNAALTIMTMESSTMKRVTYASAITIVISMFLPYFLCPHHHQHRIRQLSAPLKTSSWRQCPGIRCHPRRTKCKLWKLSADSGANGFASIQDEPNADYDNCWSCLRLRINVEAPDKYTIPSWQCPSFVVLSQSRQINNMGSYTEGTYWYTREGTATSLFCGNTSATSLSAWVLELKPIYLWHSFRQ